MKKILSTLLLACTIGLTANAAAGDTTRVVSHTLTSFLHYGNFDTAVVFPDGTKDYRKINMVFTLGKETCPAGSQYCAQWDYTVQLLVMTPTDTFELGRFITPYAHSSYPNMPLTWTHDYVYDLTDYYDILKNGAVVRIHYSGYSWGFTGKMHFDFIEGTRPRDVVGIEKLWNKSYKFGSTADPINVRTAERTITKPTGTVYAEARHIISGHGSDDQTNNCAEFCNKWYKWMVNGSAAQQVDIWRDDCGDNWVYPQSGTWVYDRANWCPGDVVFAKTLKVPASALTGPTFTAGMEFQPYTSSNQSNPPSYTTSNSIFFYKEFNHTVDAGIEDIVAPTNKDIYFRMNPICNEVKVKIKNYGKNDLTSVKMDYGIAGQATNTFTWNGTLASNETAIISLPSLAAFKTITGTQQFGVIIKEVNGAADQESHNDTATSTFVAPPKWNKGNFIIKMVTSSFTQPGNASKWIIKDQTGAVIMQRSSTSATQTYNDTVHLENGCYTFEAVAEYGYGFRFLTAFTAGSLAVNMYDGSGGLALPKYNPGNSGLAGDFGNGFVQEFVVTNSEPLLSVRSWNNAIQMTVAPNPAQDNVTVNVDGLTDNSATIHITNMLGQTVLTQKANQAVNTIDVHQLPAGIYHLIYDCNRGSKMEKLVISR